MVWNAQLLPEQSQHADGEALSLGQSKTEDEPQDRHHLDLRIRMPSLAPRCGGGPSEWGGGGRARRSKRTLESVTVGRQQGHPPHCPEARRINAR